MLLSIMISYLVVFIAIAFLMVCVLRAAQRDKQRMHQKTIRQAQEPLLGNPPPTPPEDTLPTSPPPPTGPPPAPPVVEAAPTPPPVPPHTDFTPDVVILRLIAPASRPYPGKALLRAFHAAGLHYGKQQIFHAYTHPAQQTGLRFSVASAVEPGTFAIDTLHTTSTPGISLFLQLSRTKTPYADWKAMLRTARKLAGDVGGELRDEKNRPLTPEIVTRLRAHVENR